MARKGYNLLDQATLANQYVRQQIIHELAGRPDEVLPVVMSALTSAPKSRWQVAVQVIRAIGYPQNKETIPALLAHLSDGNSPAWNEVAQTLAEMEARIVAPYLIAILWERGQTKSDWVDYVQGISSLLDFASPDLARYCAPTVSFLFSQRELFQTFDELDPMWFVSMLKRAGSECLLYAMSPLVDFLQGQEDEEVAVSIRDFIGTADEGVRALYKQLLE